MNEEDKAFFVGMAIGVIALGALLAVFGLSPRQMTEKHQQEAVAAGVAEWIIETNESGEPEMKFQWKQLK